MSLNNTIIGPTKVGKSGSEESRAARQAEVNPSYPPATPPKHPDPTPHEVSVRFGAATGALFSRLNSLMRDKPRIHRYSRRFSCGAGATARFKQFKRAASMKVRWKVPCRCETPEAKSRCHDELHTWLAEVEAREVSSRHFRFCHKGSKMFDVGGMGTFIYPSIGRAS
jgi:hypothetical protein